jgi:hypothetical protein
MGILVFLSRAEPYRDGQRAFLGELCTHLRGHGLDPRTVGETDFDMSGLSAIRGLLMQSHGLVSVAFRRMLVEDGQDRPDPDVSLTRSQKVPLEKPTWLTTPWCHMETAMAYQMGLPILLLVEKGVRLEGVLEGGVLGQYPPEFDVEASTDTLEGYFDNHEKWRQLSATWEGQVREVLRNRSSPRPLFGNVHG